MSEKVDHRPGITVLHEDDFVGNGGEVPAHIEDIPGVIEWSPSVIPSKDLIAEAHAHLENEPWIIEVAKKRKADIAAAITGDGRKIFIAVGAVALVATIAGVEIYRHKHQEDKPKQNVKDEGV